MHIITSTIGTRTCNGNTRNHRRTKQNLVPRYVAVASLTHAPTHHHFPPRNLTLSNPTQQLRKLHNNERAIQIRMLRQLFFSIKVQATMRRYMHIQMLLGKYIIKCTLESTLSNVPHHVFSNAICHCCRLTLSGTLQGMSSRAPPLKHIKPSPWRWHPIRRKK